MRILDRFACRLVGHRGTDFVCPDCGEFDELYVSRMLDAALRVSACVIQISVDLRGFGVSMREAMEATKRLASSLRPRTYEDAMEEAGQQVDAWQERQNRVYVPRRLMVDRDA